MRSNLVLTIGEHLPLTQLQDANGDVIAFFRPIKGIRFPIGDVYGELHFLRNAGAGTVVRLASYRSNDIFYPN
jgi:hypothetical protein